MLEFCTPLLWGKAVPTTGNSSLIAKKHAEHAQMVCAMLPARAVVSAAAPPRRCVAARASPAPTHTPSALRPGESAEEAARRRERESARVEERTKARSPSRSIALPDRPHGAGTSAATHAR